MAIMQYIGKKSNLVAKTENEQIRIDVIQNQIQDLRNSFVQTCKSPDFVSTTIEIVISCDAPNYKDAKHYYI